MQWTCIIRSDMIGEQKYLWVSEHLDEICWKTVLTGGEAVQQAGE